MRARRSRSLRASHVAVVIHRISWLAPVALLALSACGTLPESTEKARGLLAGQNIVLAMTVLFVVAAVGLIAAVVGLDRFMRSRARLAEAPEVVEDVEEADEVVAGITVGRAAVPRWLYGAYVLIPIFAFAYVASNIRPPESAAEATPEPTPSGPCTECSIEAIPTIKFSTDTLVVAAGESITVAFDNDDASVPHDFTVWEEEAAAQGGGTGVATTGTVNGGSSGEAKFNADEVTYFNCTIHPQSMFGTIEAE